MIVMRLVPRAQRQQQIVLPVPWLRKFYIRAPVTTTVHRERTHQVLLAETVMFLA